MSESNNMFVQFQLPKVVSATYDPQPDITAYELAQLLPIFIYGSLLTEEKWTELGSATRHLKRSA